MNDGILSAGLRGIHSGTAQAQQAAQTIARNDRADAGEEPSAAALTEAVVELKRGEQQVQASAEVVQTADEVLGTLIDTKA